MAGFFSRLVKGLSKSRDNMGQGVDDALSGYTSIDEDFYDEIEEILVMGMSESAQRLPS